MTPEALRSFLETGDAAVLIELAAVKGSSPREAGAFMLVSATRETGTIGGGALEYLAIDRARQALRHGIADQSFDIPLGPELGQCCGGHVELRLRFLTPALAGEVVSRLEAEQAARPHVFVFGSGHVGKALLRHLAPLPLAVHAVDTRADALSDLPPAIIRHAVPMPEALVRSAPLGTSYVILTHDHALDFLIAAEALSRKDAPYVGMVGSKTKRARFKSWYESQGHDPERLEKLTLPVGSVPGLGDKRPEVIALMTAAELLAKVMTGMRQGDAVATGAGQGAHGQRE